MTIAISKLLRGGQFFVRISVSDITPIEKERIEKFGSPEIPLLPKYLMVSGNILYALPLHQFNHEFGFNNEQEANNFANSMKNRLKQAVDSLKTREDKFTGDEKIKL